MLEDYIYATSCLCGVKFDVDRSDGLDVCYLFLCSVSCILFINSGGIYVVRCWRIHRFGVNGLIFLCNLIQVVVLGVNDNSYDC